MSKNVLFYGSLASIGCAATFLFGFVLLINQLLPYIELQSSPEGAVEFVLDHFVLIGLWNFIIYILFGVLLALLVVALHHRFVLVQPILSQLAAAFGIVWVTLVIASGMLANVGLSKVVQIATDQPALAQSLWLSIVTLKEGMGGGNELVGGIWVLLVSIVLVSVYSRAVSFLGIVAGVAGILSSIPALGDAGAVFGLLLIVWFVWLGILMLHESNSLNVRLN